MDASKYLVGSLLIGGTRVDPFSFWVPLHLRIEVGLRESTSVRWLMVQRDPLTETARLAWEEMDV